MFDRNTFELRKRAIRPEASIVINSANYEKFNISSISDIELNRVYTLDSTITQSMISGLPVYGVNHFVMSYAPLDGVYNRVYIDYVYSSEGVVVYLASYIGSLGTISDWVLQASQQSATLDYIHKITLTLTGEKTGKVFVNLVNEKSAPYTKVTFLEKMAPASATEKSSVLVFGYINDDTATYAVSRAWLVSESVIGFVAVISNIIGGSITQNVYQISTDDFTIEDDVVLL